MQKIKVYFTFSILAFLSFSIVIQMILPVPFGLIAAIISFMIMPLILGYAFKNKIHEFGVSIPGNVKLKKVCLVCNKESKDDSCSRCGSKAFKYQ